MQNSPASKPFIGLIPLFILFLTGTVSPKNYYVSNSGRWTNEGTSIGEAFGSINHAVEIAQPGDSIFILPGRYSGVIAVNDRSGDPEKPICILGYSQEEKDYPVIDGGARAPSSNADDDWMSVKGSRWIVIGRMKFENGWTYPIKIENSSYITFDKCMFWGGKRVISATGVCTHHLLVENCYWDQGGDYLWSVEKDSAGEPAWLSMHHLAMKYFNGSLIDFHGTGGSIVIRNNKITNAFNALRWRGIKGYDSNIEIYGNHISQIRDNDFEPEYYTFNLHIYHNFCHNIHRTLSIDNVDGGDIYYYGNVVTTDSKEWTVNVCAGFGKIYGEARNLDYPLFIFNNSFYGVANAYRAEVGTFVQVKHFNNAYYFSRDNGWVLSKWDSTDAFDYDVSNKGWPDNITTNRQERHGRIADVDYVDGGNYDLRLRGDSPGRGAGTPLKFKEFDWTQRFTGKGPDVGAYEGNRLVEGPPFRLIVPPGTELTYEEKPRIVRDDVDGKRLILYFSVPIDPGTIKKGDVSLYLDNKEIDVSNVSVGNENYSIIIDGNTDLSAGIPSISFRLLPYGMNKQQATYWASTIKIHE